MKKTSLISESLTVIFLVSGCTQGVGSAESAEPAAYPVELPFEKVLPGTITDYEFMRAFSGPGREYLLDTSVLTAEGLVLEGKKGRSGTNDKPWIMLRNMKSGKGIAVSLAYSGNWRLTVKPEGNDVRLKAATLPESLKPFKNVAGMPMPGGLAVEFQGDWDDGAQPLVKFIRSKLLRNLGKDWPWVQFNVWFDRTQEIDEKQLLGLAKGAGELGCELFVIDAGWMGRDNLHYNQVLGDWHVNRQRLPNGIEPIVQEVRNRGMKFGMWVEIENASPQTPVAKAHPEWFLRDGDQLASKRACLDFGNPEALAWAKGEIDRIVTSFGLDYIKMDFNTDLKVDSEKYKEADPLYRHYRGLVELWDHMRTKYPHLIIENCSGGSRRADLMTAAATDTHWISDQVGRADNLAMNFGMTYLYPPEMCTHWTRFPLPTEKHADIMDVQSCFTISMLGEMGLSGPLALWDEKTRRIATDTIKAYKKIRPILKKAEVYHLTKQVNHAKPASMQVAEYLDRMADQGVVFAFQAGDPLLEGKVKLRGLEPDREYKIKSLIGSMPEKKAKGSELADGLEIKFTSRGASMVLLIEAAETVAAKPCN